MSDFNTRMGCHVWKDGRKEEGREEGREEGERKPAGISSSTPLHSGWLKGKSKKQFF